MKKVKIYYALLIIILLTNSCSYLYHNTNLIGSHRIYGSACGFLGGQTSKYRREIEVNIKNQAIDKINKWLFSADKIKKTYATEALIRLHNKDSIKLTINQIRKINSVKNSKRKINTCRGCLYNYKTLKDALADYEIK